MGQETDNTRRVLAACQAWNDSKGASVDTWLELFARDGDLTSIAGGRPGLAFSAPVKGRAELRRYLEALIADWEMIHYRMGDPIADGDRLALSGEIAYRNRASGKTFTSRKVDLLRFEDGYIADFYESFDTAALVAALP
jgi:ketosteroid isomerase-like protein